MKAIAAVIGVVFLSPLLLVGTAMTVAAGGQSGAASTLGGCLAGTDSDVTGVAKKVTAILDGADTEDVRIQGLDLPAEQIPSAKTIVATGMSLHVPAKGQVIALATAMQESRLRNLDSGDRDSLGLFQQRPSQGWGTAAQISDPVYASEQFYKHLLKVSGWQQMQVTQAAQAVQRSGAPDAYARWESLAAALQRAVATTFPGADEAEPSKKEARADGTGVGGCAPGDGGTSWGWIPEGSVPKGYTIPVDADPKARRAIGWAMRQLGTLYQWGGSCTNAHGPDPMARCDCSSLTQQAYKHAGVALPRTTYSQVNVGKRVSPTALVPGDLIFSRGSAARPEHVGMYIGEGLVIEAPRPTKPVRISPLKSIDVLAARRIL